MIKKYQDKLDRAKKLAIEAVGNARSKAEEMLLTTSSETLKGWCSWCGGFSEHHLVRYNRVSRSLYRCASCEKSVVKCRYCENFARAANIVIEEPVEQEADVVVGECRFEALDKYFADNWNNELCAEHDGSISDFSKSKDKIIELGEFRNLMRPARPNIYGSAKKYSVIAGSVVAVGSGAWMAAPGIAAALGSAGILGAASTGTAIGSLSGAALTAASVAKLGAGGLAIVAAVGGGLGGQTGFGLANAYLKDVPDYNFSFKRGAFGDTNHRVIFVNGFLSEDDKDAHDWCDGLGCHYLTSPLWYLEWESKTLLRLGQALGTASRDLAVRQAFATGIAVGSKALAKSVAAGGGILAVANLASNPWHSAMLNAEKSGALLAEAIVRCEGKTFTLMGHSLGARVVHFALQALATKGGEKRIKDVVLMGGAVGNHDLKSWTMAASAASGRLHNCYSELDGVLKGLYQLANVGQSVPAGLKPTGFSIENLNEVDFTYLIKGHNKWKENLASVLNSLELGVSAE